MLEDYLLDIAFLIAGIYNFIGLIFLVWWIGALKSEADMLLSRPFFAAKLMLFWPWYLIEYLWTRRHWK